MAIPWNEPRVDGEIYWAEQFNARTDWLEVRHKNFIDGEPSTLTLTKDNGGYERRPVFEKWDNDSLAAYTITGAGTATVASSILTCSGVKLVYKNLDANSTVGVWDVVFAPHTTYASDQLVDVILGSNGSYLKIKRGSGNAISLGLDINNVQIIAYATTGTTLANDAYGRPSVKYDGTNYQMCWNDVAVGSATPGPAITTPQLGIFNVSSGTTTYCHEMNYIPSIAFADSTPGTNLTRYAAMNGATIANSATKMKITSPSAAWGITRARSNLYKSGSFYKEVVIPATPQHDDMCLISLDSNPSGITGTSLTDMSFGIRYRTSKWVTDIEVKNTTTTIGTADLGYSGGDVVSIYLERDAESGVCYGYTWKTSGTKPTEPNVIFFTSLTEPKYLRTTTYSASGTEDWTVNKIEVRANSIVSETNVPAYETFYLHDEFTVDSSGRWTPSSGTVSVAGGKLVQGATSGQNIFLTPFKMSWAIIPTVVSFKFVIPASGYCEIDMSQGVIESTISNGYRLQFDAANDIISLIERYGGNNYATLINNAACTLDTGTEYTATVTYNVNKTIRVQITAGTTFDQTSAAGTYWNSGILSFRQNNATQNTIDDLVISGTRVYNAPQLRGAMMGRMMINGVDTPCTWFGSDFDWDVTGEMSTNQWTIDTANGRIYTTTHTKRFVFAGPRFLSGTSPHIIDFEISWASPGATTSKDPISFGFDARGDGEEGKSQYHLYSSGYFYIGTAYTYIGNLGMNSAGTRYRVTVFNDGTNVYVYKDGVLALTTATKPSAVTGGGYVIFNQYNAGVNASPSIYRFNVSAQLVTATNGIAATLGGIANGARFDTQESASSTLVNAARYGQYNLSTAVQSTNYQNSDVEFYYWNSTDSTSIASDGSFRQDIAISSSAFEDFLVPLIFRYRDRSDTIAVYIRRKNYLGPSMDNQPAVFVDYMGLFPICEV